MEMSVAVMLVVLGIMNVTGAVRAIRERADGVRATLTSAAGAPAASRPLEGARLFRPLVIGVVHGMAGSAAIALLVLATIRTPVWAVVYLGVFGLGTILGMGILTLAIAVPILRVSAGSEVYERTLIRVTGFVSIALGLFLVYRIGVVDGLFVGKTLLWTPE
jgi:high-affinity nickel-transport protein